MIKSLSTHIQVTDMALLGMFSYQMNNQRSNTSWVGEWGFPILPLKFIISSTIM